MKCRTFRVVFFSSILLNGITAALVFSPLTNWLHKPLTVQPMVVPADAILILSGEAYGDSLLGRNSLQRLAHGLSLYRQKLAQRIIVAGGPDQNAITTMNKSRAEIMREHLVTMGVPPQQIITETRSQNTYENLLYSKEIAASLQLDRLLVVTSCAHMYRTMLVAEKAGCNMLPAPVPCFEQQLIHSALRARFVLDILREYAAIAYFWFKGWI